MNQFLKPFPLFQCGSHAQRFLSFLTTSFSSTLFPAFKRLFLNDFKWQQQTRATETTVMEKSGLQLSASTAHRRLSCKQILFLKKTSESTKGIDVVQTYQCKACKTISVVSFHLSQTYRQTDRCVQKLWHLKKKAKKTKQKKKHETWG